jgi:hypothetical protein
MCNEQDSSLSRVPVCPRAAARARGRAAVIADRREDAVEEVEGLVLVNYR